MLKLPKLNYHHLISFLSIFLFLNSPVYAYELGDKLETIIVGKVAKYISWGKPISDKFVIVVLKNQFGMLFNEVYAKKKIKSKPVKIEHIDNIYKLNDCEILFISKENDNLKEILEYTKNKNILTISDKRGFAQRGGIIQLYLVGQSLKIKINIDIMQREGFKVDRTLLRIVDIIKRGS